MRIMVGFLSLPDRIRRHPILAYFVMAYAISWVGVTAVGAPRLMRDESISSMDQGLMFVFMLLGPSATGVILTRIVDGHTGLSTLWASMRRARFRARWYLPLLIPPLLVVIILSSLRALVSFAFVPSHFVAAGVGIGLVAGYFEEIGWMGYAFPKMAYAHGALIASIGLGLLWAAWHGPADYLGNAVAGPWWLAHFLAFIAAMTAMRVLIAWMYANTASIWLAQLMHASSTGTLVALTPATANAFQETLWYAVYAGALWIAVAVIAIRGDWRRTRIEQLYS